MIWLQSYTKIQYVLLVYMDMERRHQLQQAMEDPHLAAPSPMPVRTTDQHQPQSALHRPLATPLHKCDMILPYQVVNLTAHDLPRAVQATKHPPLEAPTPSRPPAKPYYRPGTATDPNLTTWLQRITLTLRNPQV